MTKAQFAKLWANRQACENCKLRILIANLRQESANRQRLSNGLFAKLK